MVPELPLGIAVEAGRCRVSGELVGESALTLSSAIQQHAAAVRPTGLELDLSAVSFIDSVGLRELLRLTNALPAIRLVAVSELVRQRTDLTGTTGLLLDADAMRPPPPEQ